MADFTIEHDDIEQQFFIQLPEQEQAYMRYRFVDDADSVVDFYTTFVPSSQRGKGLAGYLVAAGFDWAESQQYQIQASCLYADRILQSRQS